EIAVDDHRHAMPRIEREELRLARIACRKRKHLALVFECLVLERQLHAPCIGRAGTVIKRDHRVPPLPRMASSDAFCNSMVLMLICIMDSVMVSQFWTMRSS